MTSLENLARLLFQKYSQEKLERVVPWEHLSEPRKLAWMEEVLLVSKHLTDVYKTSFKNPPPLSQINTSYVMGRNDGITQERNALRSFIETVHKGLEREYSEYTKDDE